MNPKKRLFASVCTLSKLLIHIIFSFKDLSFCDFCDNIMFFAKVFLGAANAAYVSLGIMAFSALVIAGFAVVVALRNPDSFDLKTIVLVVVVVIVVEIVIVLVSLVAGAFATAF